MSLREIRKPVPGLHIKTEEEYFEFEEGALEKHEFYKGEIFAMAGASVAHNRIVRNSLTAIDAFSKAKDCEVFLSDLKVHVEANSLFTYPDLSILCGKPIFTTTGQIQLRTRLFW
jgi:Uma2 family endonuclease